MTSGALFAGAYAQVHVALQSNLNMARVPARVPIATNRRAGSRSSVATALDGAAHSDRQDFGDSVEVVAGLSPSDRVIDSPSTRSAIASSALMTFTSCCLFSAGVSP
jgi:hypothetical protein